MRTSRIALAFQLLKGLILIFIGSVMLFYGMKPVGHFLRQIPVWGLIRTFVF